ncbi:unnamed protein product [Penicillium salamii]|nr:unnamed protein product [Penicillium salamii]CAG8401160.1 unnamed protein product [Penicillium salamii]
MTLRLINSVGRSMQCPVCLRFGVSDERFRLPEVIGQHSAQKPIMVFCCTRNSSLTTAKELARLWTLTNPPARLWKGPQKHLDASNEELKTSLAAGVAFHHAGLGPADRHTVEMGFKEGHISVICCTSTLAVGVNLPCHLVIIKNTVGWQDGRCKEYSDLEMMQMLGRAGRPQFDDSATAVILTKKDRVAHYEKLVQGSESLESCLHLNLIDHLNAEIGLGNVCDVQSAVKWLAGTFLFVRLSRNPTHYNLKEGAKQEDEDEMLRQICEKDINMLRECGLIETESLCSTEAGEAMARYYIRFETMKALLSLKSKATLHETLNAISLASEFHEVRLKANEKALYKEINRDTGIRFPINVDLALPTHKVSLLIQSELGAIDFPDAEGLQKHKFTFNQDKGIVFAHVNRLIRCLIDCQIARSDSISICSALELARSLGAKVWDHSPLQMKQLEQIGVVAVRKLAAAGITSIEGLECTEAHQIEVVLSKNPPFGSKLLARLREFPKLWVAVKMIKKDVKFDCVNIHFGVELAFMNDKTPTMFQRKPVHVCCLTERSDGHMIDFRRMRMQNGLKIELSAQLTSADETILCHVMCDEIAGTSQKAELLPDLPAHAFATLQKKDTDVHNQMKQINVSIDSAATAAISNTKDQVVHSTQGFIAINKPGTPTAPHSRLRRETRDVNQGCQDLDDFDGDDLQIDDFLNVQDHRKKTKHSCHRPPLQFDDTDWLSIATSSSSPPKISTKASKSHVSHGEDWAAEMDRQDEEEYELTRLANGKWACNHKCNDKTSCKHFCCREGLDKPPSKPKKRAARKTQKEDGLNQLTIPTSLTKTAANASYKGNLATKKLKADPKNALSGSKPNSSIPQLKKKASAQGRLALVEKDKNAVLAKRKEPPVKPLSSDYGDDSFDDLPSPSKLMVDFRKNLAKRESSACNAPEKETAFTPSDIEKGRIKSTVHPTKRSQLHQTKPSKPTTPNEHEIIEISDDTPPKATLNSVELLESTATGQNTLQVPAEERSDDMKRKASQDENQTTKRFKHNPFVTPFQVQSPEAPKSEEAPLDPKDSDLPVPRTWFDLNAEWLRDDIDMIEEFKNIVDFI